MERCKICQEILVTSSANYCSTECRHLDSRLFFTRNTLILASFGLLSYILIIISMELVNGYSALTVAGVILLVLVPLYRYYHTISVQATQKMNHSQLKFSNLTEKENHPVYIYLYINRHTERMVQDEDYSEFM